MPIQPAVLLDDLYPERCNLGPYPTILQGATHQGEEQALPVLHDLQYGCRVRLYLLLCGVLAVPNSYRCRISPLSVGVSTLHVYLFIVRPSVRPSTRPSARLSDEVAF